MAEIHLTIDCAAPERLVPFWCAALRYVPEPPPAGHDTWRSYYLSIGEPEEELGDGDACDRVVDPDGQGAPIWFQVVPEPKTTKKIVCISTSRSPTAATTGRRGERPWRPERRSWWRSEVYCGDRSPMIQENTLPAASTTPKVTSSAWSEAGDDALTGDVGADLAEQFEIDTAVMGDPAGALRPLVHESGCDRCFL